MNPMLKFKDLLVNKNHIQYVDYTYETNTITIVCIKEIKYVIEYENKEDLLVDLETLVEYFCEVEATLFLNLDNVVGIEPIKLNRKDAIRVSFTDKSTICVGLGGVKTDY